MKKQLSIRTMTSVAVLSAVAFVLAFFEFPVPLSPSFARMDLSDFPALIGAFAFGPVAGILIELVKNLLGLFSTATSGVGELANFLMGASFAATAGLIYKQHKTKRTALIGGIIGSVVMGIVAALANYFILLPLFEQFMPLEPGDCILRSVYPIYQNKAGCCSVQCIPIQLAERTCDNWIHNARI